MSPANYRATASANRLLADGRSSYLRWWTLPGLVTVLLLLFNSPWTRRSFPDAYRLKQWVLGFHLEMNFAVWWSVVLLLLSAALFYEMASDKGRRRRPFLELSLVLLALLIDELGSLHERISGFGGWASLAPFGLVLAALLVDALRLLWREREMRPVVWLVLAGFVVLGSVVGQEYAEHNLTSAGWSEWWGRFLEETTELVGAMLILAGAVYGRQRRWNGPAADAVPDPTRMARLLPLLAIGAVLHIAAAQILYLPKVGPQRWYGSPAAIYPAIVFFVLACYAFWVPRHRLADSSRSPEVAVFWNATGLFFLACSLGFVQNLWGLVGRLVPGLGKRHFYEPIPIWVALILVAWFIGFGLRRQIGRHVLWLAALPLAPVIHLRLEHPGATHLAAGFFACLCALAILSSAVAVAAASRAPDLADPG